jgi:hypothetical protein
MAAMMRTISVLNENGRGIAPLSNDGERTT